MIVPGELSVGLVLGGVFFFLKAYLVEGDDVILCGLDEIWAEDYCRNLHSYRLFVI